MESLIWRPSPSREGSLCVPDGGLGVDAKLVNRERVGVSGFAEATIAFAPRQAGVAPGVFDDEGSAPTVGDEHPGGF